jgi:dTMP kinase
MRGKFIVFEGIDGSGKSTQVRLLEQALLRRRIRVEKIREPGATRIGERIRELLLDTRSEMNTVCELFLYMAARAQLVQERILPLLRDGTWVICDRYVYSSAAYQGAAGGLGIDKVMQIGQAAIDGAIPDRIFLLDLKPAEAAKRMEGKAADRIEKRGLEYQNKVRNGFRKLKRRLGKRLVILPATRSPEEIHQTLLKELRLS